jgi:uncharacterized membrane protein
MQQSKEVRKMLQTKTQKLTNAGMLIAIGLILPYATSHMFGIPGTVLLPMHIPALLIGFLCGPLYGFLCGLIIPALSSALTGMPAAYPMLPIMLGELATYGLVSGLLYQKTSHLRKRLAIYPVLLTAMVCGRIVYGLIFSILMLAGGQLKALSVWGAIATGLPGIVIQLILIPSVVMALEHGMGRRKMDSLQSAINLIKEETATCVVMKDHKIIKTISGQGIAPVIDLYEQGVLKDAFVADKIIGKAAAMIMVLGGVKEVYGKVMSRAGKEYLESRGVKVSNGQCIDMISNRAGNGICPMERTVMEIEEPAEALAALKETLATLRKQA